ncbi:hypothetical protein F2Q69_00062660 [Brassica cretica]|uniref:Uncharacterized protein n=1 Tax=Brassica cretica TaxID=69181 RepID=A0A8S9RJB3_BRACR|nr:hypothetical protein F2Q69_00062660 [Brassica cretica]
MPSLTPPLTSTDASIIATKPYQNNSYPQNQLSNHRPWALQRFSPSSRWRLSLLHSVSDQTFMAEKLSDDSILSVNPKPSKCFSSKLIDLLELLVVKLMHDASLPLRYLSGNFAPLRDETPPVKDLPVHGFLPECLNGIFLRVGPNPKFDPLAGYHWHVLFFPCLMEMGRLCLTPSSLMFRIHFSPISTLTHRNGLEGGLGSQMIHGVRIKDGKATYVSRFVKTSRLQQEEFFGDAKLMKIGDLKGFFGLVMVIMQQLRIKLKVLDDSYGNGTANTSLIFHHGKLLALQETDKPYVIKVLEDGDLQTLGMTEYDKRLTHSFTAHPKVDPVTGKSSIFPEKHDIVFLLTHDVPYLFTGEMFTFGCSPMPPYLTYRVISKDGIMHDPVPITISKPIMMHDFAITENYAIFMDLPMHFRPKEMVKEKKMIYSFDPTKKARFGIQVYIGLRAALSCEWIRQLFVWVTLELRFMTLVSDIPMVLVLFGPTLATSNSIFIALARSSAVCSSLTGSIPGIGVMFVYLSSWWQVEEKLIFIFSLMNMDVAGYDFSLVPRLNQSSFLILPPIWSELEEQASLVLQGSSSHRMLFSAYGAVCVVLRVTLDAIFEVAYDVVVIRSHMFSFCDLCRHSIFYVFVGVVCLAVNSLFVSSFIGV